MTNFANEWMNYSDHPKYDIIKKELDNLYNNLDSKFNIQTLETAINNIFLANGLDQEFEAYYMDQLGTIEINDIGYRINKDDTQQPE